MPTSRAYSFAAASIVIYLFGNQTQVGWLYVVSALMLGVVAAGWLLSRGSLKGLGGKRQIGNTLDADLYEGEEVEIMLQIDKIKGAASSLVRIEETCPLAAPDSPQRRAQLFIPALAEGEAVQFEYTVTLDRRGLYTFPSLNAESRAPFGFFRRNGQLNIPTRTLVYPEIRPLKRLELLDRQLTAQVARPRAGVGYEVMGVRPYRPGDSPRHIHWRSVARTGTLISKEFADEAQPGLTLVLDLFKHPYPTTKSKHTPFEWAVKAAASIGDYAQRRGYSLYVISDDEVIPAPQGAVGEMALLQYLARVQPTGKRPLTQIIGGQMTQQFAAVMMPYPDSQSVEALLKLRQQGVEVLAVVMDGASFPAAGESSANVAGALKAAGVMVREVTFGDDWAGQIQ
ncbi:MAG: DUF58 domain-containing protein [Anaerolineaceae bacterium]|nr:DUF58 domain-containing protein [Anaerolineaceae bacterium]